MQWIEELRGETVALDTAPLIYLIERNANYLEMMRFFFRALNSGEFRSEAAASAAAASVLEIKRNWNLLP